MKQNWKREFRKKFPYKGMIIEDNGYHYTFEDIETFIQSLLDGKDRERDEMVRETIEEITIKDGEYYYARTITMEEIINIAKKYGIKL
jgi:hypothetical protein